MKTIDIEKFKKDAQIKEGYGLLLQTEDYALQWEAIFNEVNSKSQYQLDIVPNHALFEDSFCEELISFYSKTFTYAELLGYIEKHKMALEQLMQALSSISDLYVKWV